MMITRDFTNLEKISKEHGITPREIEPFKEQIALRLDSIHQKRQGFYNLPQNKKEIEKIKEFTKQNKDKYKDYVVLGIGGSALGTICLKASLKPNANLHIVDNIDPSLINEIEEKIELKTTLFIVVTKSGATPETLSQYFYFRKKIEEANLKSKKHFVFITDPKKGLLREIANEEDIQTFEIPENVGGRFSVLTPVGLLPASLIGIDIEKLMHGANILRESFLSPNYKENLPFQLALAQFLLYKKGKSITIMMPYSQRLIKLSDWYRQLLAESIGKDGVGITPVNALGVTDQHSQSQLYNDGPNDKLVIFIEVENITPTLKIPNLKPEEQSTSYLKNVTFNKLLKTEKTGTEKALTQKDKPNITLKITEVDEQNIGELFMLFEGSIAFLGELFKINAFDQPGVELSKQLTKQLLLQND